MTVLLSTTSQELIAQISKHDQNIGTLFQQSTTVDKKSLITWLAQPHSINSNDEAFFLLTSLEASLLKDLNRSISVSSNKKEKSNKGSKAGKAQLALLALAGTIYFGCEGFDGITSVMGIFSSIPAFAFFAAGTAFSILSIVVFFSFDLVEISKNLGVKSSDAPKLLDVLLDEFKQIKSLRSRLSKSANKTPQELEEDLVIARMLLKRHEALNDARIKLKQALENPYLKAGKIITAGVAGIIFFSGGFFAGQTVSLAIASLFVATMTATAWPIVAASLVVGLAAFSVYWYVERPGIENLISRWKGFDKEKMDKFCKTKVVDRETEKLQNLIAGIEEKLSLHSLNATAQSHINHLEVEVSSLRKQLTEKTKFDALPQVAHANNDEILNDFINGNESNSVKEVASSPHVQCSLFKSNDQKSRVDIRSQESLYTQGASF